MSKIPERKECLETPEKCGCSIEVVNHCIAVEKLASKIGQLCKADMRLVIAGALLHDIGRSKTHGIKHGLEGAKIARDLGLPDEIIRIIERHIGAGLTAHDALTAGLPHTDYIPSTLEEKVVCHADSLISGSRKQTLSELIESFGKKGLHDASKRALAMHTELCNLCGVDLDELDL